MTTFSREIYLTIKSSLEYIVFAISGEHLLQVYAGEMSTAVERSFTNMFMDEAEEFIYLAIHGI